jgi:ribonuclease P protein component
MAGGDGGVGRRGRRGRLSRSADFDRVYREGRSHASRWLVLYSFPRAVGSSEDPRLGVSVGRKVGGAVERNRAKRVLREAFWAVAPELPEGHDFVLVARPDAGTLVRDGGAPAVEQALRELVSSSGLMSSGQAAETP